MQNEAKKGRRWRSRRLSTIKGNKRKEAGEVTEANQEQEGFLSLNSEGREVKGR